MKKSIRIFLIILGLFCIGGLGSLFVNYIVYSKLVTNPVLSDNDIIKALSSKVIVTEHTKETIIKDNESVSTISAQVSAGVVFVEEMLPISSSRAPYKGNGIVMSSDGIIAIHESVFRYENSEDYKVSFFDGSVYKAKKVYKDDFSGVIFLQVEDEVNLTVMPFANSSDAISGRKLINIYREKMSDEIFFTLGILSGYDYLFQTKQPSCDYLEGAFRVDFNEKSLEYGLGGPMIDFNGEMVGVITKNYKDEYFLLASDDIKSAFNKFLENNGEKFERDFKEDRVRLGVSCSSVFNDELSGVRINYSVDSIEFKNVSKNIAKDLGINDWDIITHVDDHEIGPKNPLSRILFNYKKGDTAKFKLLRNDKTIEVDINF